MNGRGPKWHGAVSIEDELGHQPRRERHVGRCRPRDDRRNRNRLNVSAPSDRRVRTKKRPRSCTGANSRCFQFARCKFCFGLFSSFSFAPMSSRRRRVLGGRRLLWEGRPPGGMDRPPPLARYKRGSEISRTQKFRRAEAKRPRGGRPGR